MIWQLGFKTITAPLVEGGGGGGGGGGGVCSGSFRAQARTADYVIGKVCHSRLDSPLA